MCPFFTKKDKESLKKVFFPSNLQPSVEHLHSKMLPEITKLKENKFVHIWVGSIPLTDRIRKIDQKQSNAVLQQSAGQQQE